MSQASSLSTEPEDLGNVCLSGARSFEAANKELGEKSLAQFLRNNPNRRLHGTGTLRAKAVIEMGLAIDANNRPPRHANIIGWDNKKERQKLQAAKLASRAQLLLF